MNARGRACAYCGQPAAHMDHVVPRSIRRKAVAVVPPELLATEPSCTSCNWRKMSRRLVPVSWADKIPALNEAFPGTPWRVWFGTTSEPAFSEAWT